MAGIGLGRRKLRSHDRGGTVFLVHALAEDDRQVGCDAGGSFDRLAVTTKWRTLVARHEGSGIETGSPISPQLLQRQPSEGLNAGQEHRAFVGLVSVVELVMRGGCHGRSFNSQRIRPQSLPMFICCAQQSYNVRSSSVLG